MTTMLSCVKKRSPILYFLSFFILLSCNSDDSTTIGIGNGDGTIRAKFNELEFESERFTRADKVTGSFINGIGMGFSGSNPSNNIGSFSIYVEPVEDIGDYDLDRNSASSCTLIDAETTWSNPINKPFIVTFTEITEEKIKGTFSGTLTSPLDSIIVITNGEFDVPFTI